MEWGGKNYQVVIWTERVKFNADAICLDTETTMIDGASTPDLVTVQAYQDGDTVYFIPLDKLRPFFESITGNVIVMHNAPFDVDVICKYMENRNFFHQWIDNSLLHDTQILWKLVHLATEGYVPKRSSLAFVAQTLFNMEVDKSADIRHNFEQFLGKDVSEIPLPFLEYGAKDVLITQQIYKRLIVEAQMAGTQLLSLPIQVAGAVALERIYKRGIGFDLKTKEELFKRVEFEKDQIADRLATYGWARGIPGSNETYSRIVESLGLKLPKTESGAISSKEEDLLPYINSAQFVRDYLNFHSLEKTLSFVDGIDSTRIHPRYNNLMNTGRTSCQNPNVQQLPRDGEIRSLFVPREGHSFIITDYTAIELSALAQVTYKQFGFSKMRDLINEGRDLHKYAASQIYNIKEEDVDKSQRLLAKILNFGLGANMSPRTFVEYAKPFGVELTQEQAEELKSKWVKIFPEMRKYWDLKGEFGATFTHRTLTGRIRAKASYTACLNTGFQGLAADGFKIALYYLDVANIPVVMEVHDEIVCEIPNDKIEKVQPEVEHIMIKAMRQVIPDVEVRVEGQIAQAYCK